MLLIKNCSVTASIVHNPNGMQPPPINVIKIESPSYYCSSYTPPATDHSTTIMTSGAYSKNNPINSQKHNY